MPPPPPGQHARLAPLVSPIPRTSASFTPRFHSTNSPSLTSSIDRASPVSNPHLSTQPSLSLPHPQSRQTSGPRVVMQTDPNLANPVRITPVNFRVPREARPATAMSTTPSLASRDPLVTPSVPLPLSKRSSTRDEKFWNPLPSSRSRSNSTTLQLPRDQSAPFDPSTTSPSAQSTNTSQTTPSRPSPHTRIPPRTQFIFANSTPSPNYTSPLSSTSSPRTFSSSTHERMSIPASADARASLRPQVEEIPVKATESHQSKTRKLTLQTTPEVLNGSQRPILVEVRPENVTSQSYSYFGEPVRSPPPVVESRLVSPAPRTTTSPPVSPSIPVPPFKLSFELKWEEAKKRWDEEDRRIREGFGRTAQNTQTGFKARSDSPSPTNFSSSTGRQTPKYEWHRPVANVLGHARAHSDSRPYLGRQASSYLGSDMQEDNSSDSSSSRASRSSTSSFDSQSSFTSASSGKSHQAPRSRSNTYPRSDGNSDEKLWERLLAALDDIWDGDRDCTRVDPRVGKAWENYESRWHSLNAQPSDTPLTFADIPWPVSLTVAPASELLAQTLNARNIREFLFSPSHSKGKSNRERVRSALLRWHTDKFDAKWMARVRAEDRSLVKEAAGLVSRSLSDIVRSIEA